MEPTYKKYDISECIGKKFGRLTVIGKASQTSEYSNQFLFQCECGNIIQEQPARVIKGHKISCGKCQFARLSAKPRFDINDYIGKKRGKITVISLAERTHDDRLWKLHCECECGNFIDVTPSQFNRGVIKSCGCTKGIGYNTKDMRTKHPLYGTWRQMMGRCYNKKANRYDRYGGRGIYVCEEWHDFQKFAKWVDSIGGRPGGMTLDRIDNDGPYCPENCRFVTWEEQHTRKSSSVYFEYNGKKLTIAQWSREIGISWNTLDGRIRRGWSTEKALNTPVRKRHKKHFKNDMEV